MTASTPPGLAALARAVEGLGDVHVLAPEREQSACGHALTLHRPLRVEPLGERRFSVNGTPSDCVNLGVLGFLPERPVLVLSGINHGSNLGDDVTYSGTVSAAMEGTLLGVPSIAVSLASGGDFEEAERIARLVAMRVLVSGLPDKTLLNVNVPAGRARGIRFTRLGHRVYDGRIVEQADPRGPPALLDRGGPAPVGPARGHRHGRGARRVRGGDAAASGSDPPPGPRADAGLVDGTERPAPPRARDPRREPRRPVCARAPAHGGRSARPAGHHGRARARRHAARAAPPVRGGGLPRARLR